MFLRYSSTVLIAAILSLCSFYNVAAFTIINQTSQAVTLEIKEAEEKETVHGNVTRREVVPLKKDERKVTIPAKSRTEIAIDSCPALLISIIKVTTKKKFFKKQTETTTITIAKVPYNYNYHTGRRTPASFANDWGLLVTDLVDTSSHFKTFNDDNPTLVILNPQLLLQITSNDHLSAEVQRGLSLSPR